VSFIMWFAVVVYWNGEFGENSYRLS